MNAAIALMLTCVAIGLSSKQLGRRSYSIMAAAIIVYVIYAYRA